MGLLTANGDTDTVYITDLNNGSHTYSINNGTGVFISWPLNIVNTSSSNYLKIIFTNDCTFSSNTTQYFSCGSGYIQFGSQTLNNDGSIPTITISGISNYLGLVQNGTGGANGYANVSIYNLKVVAANAATLAGNGGWITQSYFAKGSANNLVVNCSSTGDIPDGSGGIVGGFSGNGSGSVLTVRGCSSTGTIAGSGGGIAGLLSAYLSGTVNIEQCWSSGNITGIGGGITGNSCGITGGTLTATNCYSTGAISSSGGGGIFGITNGYGTGGSATATNCYSTGAIASGAGGIFGGNAGTAGGVALASNCYSTGTVTSGGGGIYGGNYSSATAINCYTTGSSTSSGGIFTGSTSSGTNSYAETGGSWNDTRAAQYLTGAPSPKYGTSWTQLTTGQPYILSKSGYTPYSTTLGYTASASLTGGQSTAAAAVSGYAHSIIQTTVGAESYFTIVSGGAISSSIATPAGTYVVYVYSSINPYSITTYTITVALYVAPAAAVVTALTTVPCCQKTADISNITDYSTRYAFAAGNTMIGDTTVRRKAYDSYTDYLIKKMAFASKRN